MRIALLTNNIMPPSEGIGWHIFECGKRLARRGHRVTILARGSNCWHWEAKVTAGMLIRHYPYLAIRPFQHEVSRQAIQHWLDQGAGGADLLHVHLPLMPPLRTSLPMVATFHSPMLTDTAAIREPGLRAKLIRGNAQLFSHRKESWYLRRADHIVAVAENVRDELLTHYQDDQRGRLDQNRIEIIENGVDHSFFLPDATIERQPTILYVGRLGYRKGLLRLLDAFAQIAERLPFNLELIGEGPLRTVILKRARELGLENRIRMTGFQNRQAIRSALQRAACFVNPADYESGPLTLLEAIACETPVVSTRTGLAASFGDDMPIWLSDPAAQSLARQIELAVGQPELAQARAARCREQLIGRFDWDRVVDRLEAVYAPSASKAA